MKKRIITWDEVFERLSHIDKRIYQDKEACVIYGIPKGGMIAAGFLRNAHSTHDINKANIILDDLVDSGATREIYREKYPDKVFHALFDKQTEHTRDWLVFPWETDHPQREENIQQNIVRQLQYIGEDSNREGLKGTPDRIVRSWDEIFAGYTQSPKDVFTTFKNEDCYDQIILCKGIELFSMCEHHVLPFFGKAHVAYIPDQKIVGISKLARLVDVFARRLQIQERICQQVTEVIMEELKPLGAACIIEATHMCMRMRGVSKQQSTMVTSSLKGVFMTKLEAREELLRLIE